MHSLRQHLTFLLIFYCTELTLKTKQIFSVFKVFQRLITRFVICFIDYSTEQGFCSCTLIKVHVHECHLSWPFF